MSKLSVAQAAEKFKISKEAIHNRIRRGSLDCVIEHGVKYVLIDETPEVKPQTTTASAPLQDDKYHTYIENENQNLKQKIEDLENQNTRLRDQKELMLMHEKNKIEQIYKERDTQLKQVLHTITTKFLPHVQDSNIDESIMEDALEDYVDVEELESEPIRLKEFLKIKEYKSAKRERIKNRFKRLIGQDDRVFRQEGKIFIDPARFDYKDLLD